MIVQLITLKYQDVFKKYSQKYKIYRDLYQIDLYGIEIRDIDDNQTNSIKKIILDNQEICYSCKKENKFDLLFISTLSKLIELIKELIRTLGKKINRDGSE